MRARCDKCGDIYDYGADHKCQKLPIVKVSSNASSNAIDIPPKPKQDVSSNKSASRNARWRAAHPEQYRAIMRDYTRKRRAKQ